MIPLVEVLVCPLTREVQRAKQGDKQAMSRLVRQHASAAYRVAFAILGNRHDAEDAVQEAFFRAFKTLHQIRDETAFSAWLKRIVANQANDLLRKMGRDRQLINRLPTDITAQPPEEDLLRMETAQTVQQAIEKLPPGQRSAVILYYGGDYSTIEVAALLQKPVGSVKRLLSDGYKSLRRLLQLEDS